MSTFIWIGLGGFLGANARYLVQWWGINRWGTHFPIGTMVANVSGAFLLALFVTLASEQLNVREEIRLFVTTGFLGGYTTFSSWGVETWFLLNAKGILLAALNLFGNLFLGALGILLGVILARMLVQ